jgi:hypothetical protein
MKDSPFKIGSGKEALVEMHYLPSIAFFSILSRYDTVWLESQEHYQKRTYRNRSHIASANGILRLTVPLKKGKNEQQPITEVAIAYDEGWQRQHWNSIVSAYQNAPYFDFYAPYLQPYFERTFPLLFDFSRSIVEKLIELLQIEVILKSTRSYSKNPGEEITDFRGEIHPRKAPAADLPAYVQVFMEKHGFLPNLSILDLLFCTGPQASLMLEG